MYFYLLLISTILLAKVCPLKAMEMEDKSKKYASTTFISPIGKDDRVPCNDPRVGRIMPLGCTGWLMSSGCVLTAGHCPADGDIVYMQRLEFNVPLSASNGDPVDANSEDQYPIAQKSIIYSDNGKGDDWAIFHIGRNLKTGESAFVKQGQFFRIIDDWSFMGSKPIVRITGYGVDGPPPLYGYRDENNKKTPRNELSQTEQTDSGILKKENRIDHKNTLFYEVDTLNANSGSPIYFPGTHLAIGIHTQGFHPDEEHLNNGTGFKNSNLISALEDYPLPGTKLIYVDADFFAFPETTGKNGTIFKPYRKLEDAVDCIGNGATLGIVAGHYAHPGITFLKGKRITLKALAGNVKIGSAKYK